MMEQLRRAQLDVNNSNYEDSRLKIEAVKSVIHKSRASLDLGDEEDDSFDKGASGLPFSRKPIINNREET